MSGDDYISYMFSNYFDIFNYPFVSALVLFSFLTIFALTTDVKTPAAMAKELLDRCSENKDKSPFIKGSCSVLGKFFSFVVSEEKIVVVLVLFGMSAFAGSDYSYWVASSALVLLVLIADYSYFEMLVLSQLVYVYTVSKGYNLISFILVVVISVFFVLGLDNFSIYLDSIG